MIQQVPFLSFLTIPAKLRKPFKSPMPDHMRSELADELLKRKSLGMRRIWSTLSGGPGAFRRLKPSIQLTGAGVDASGDGSGDGPKFVPLVLWRSDTDPANVFVDVPAVVCKWLRPHQRTGVEFMFECCMNMRGFGGHGCILADDMGLGKTLQALAILYTLLCKGMEGASGPPVVKRAIIVCPTSLVRNWEAEITKWLGERVRCVALSEGGKANCTAGIDQFLRSYHQPVLIISYETFRMYVDKFKSPRACDLLICDEAHRLKNDQTLTNKALATLACRRRILLSGTPLQNDLDEFYAMVHFTNPGVLGTAAAFRKRFERPILAGREPDATDGERGKAQERTAELSNLVNDFILRRTNVVNAKHLPPKLTAVVCCRMTPLQNTLYKHFLMSKVAQTVLAGGKQKNVLASITALMKLVNHPMLIKEAKYSSDSGSTAPGFEDCEQYFPDPAEGGGGGDGGGGGRGSRSGGADRAACPEMSGKMLVLDRLMVQMRATTDDRIVLISNYTSTLDMMARLLRERGFPFCRLDGSTGAKKRMTLVNTFNDPAANQFAFLLSSKAGGCGLNLIGANRLVLFDPDWNPATDKQAAARCWREGQRKRCFTYRFVTTGTIEEKIFQRQLSKEGLQNVVEDKEEANSLSSKDLRDLFSLREGTVSDTLEKVFQARCGSLPMPMLSDDESEASCSDDGSSDEDEDDDDEDDDDEDDDKKKKKKKKKKKAQFKPTRAAQVAFPADADLNNWAHHLSYATVDDPVMREALGYGTLDGPGASPAEQRAADETDAGVSPVSFIFACTVDEQIVEAKIREEEATQVRLDAAREARQVQRTEDKKAAAAAAVAAATAVAAGETAAAEGGGAASAAGARTPACVPRPKKGKRSVAPTVSNSSSSSSSSSGSGSGSSSSGSDSDSGRDDDEAAPAAIASEGEFEELGEDADEAADEDGEQQQPEEFMADAEEPETDDEEAITVGSAAALARLRDQPVIEPLSDDSDFESHLAEDRGGAGGSAAAAAPAVDISMEAEEVVVEDEASPPATSDWKCEVCTLVNAPHERKCGACDGARPSQRHKRKATGATSTAASGGGKEKKKAKKKSKSRSEKTLGF